MRTLMSSRARSMARSTLAFSCWMSGMKTPVGRWQMVVGCDSFASAGARSFDHPRPTASAHSISTAPDAGDVGLDRFDVILDLLNRFVWRELDGRELLLPHHRQH